MVSCKSCIKNAVATVPSRRHCRKKITVPSRRYGTATSRLRYRQQVEPIGTSIKKFAAGSQSLQTSMGGPGQISTQAYSRQNYCRIYLRASGMAFMAQNQELGLPSHLHRVGDTCILISSPASFQLSPAQMQFDISQCMARLDFTLGLHKMIVIGLSVFCTWIIGCE